MDKGGNYKKSSILTDEQITDVKQMLKNEESFFSIEIKYNISPSFVSMINHGEYFYDSQENYPLCKYYKDDEDYDELIDLLLNSSLRMSEIAR